MKLIEINNSIIPKLCGADAITLWPCIFYAEKEPSLDLRYHEMIHMQQIKDHGVIGFYYLYAKEYIGYRILGYSHWEAYISLKFEVEAFDRQHGFKESSPAVQAELFNNLINKLYA